MSIPNLYIHVGFFYNKKENKYWTILHNNGTDFRHAYKVVEADYFKECQNNYSRIMHEIPEEYELYSVGVALQIDNTTMKPFDKISNTDL